MELIQEGVLRESHSLGAPSIFLILVRANAPVCESNSARFAPHSVINRGNCCGTCCSRCFEQAHRAGPLVSAPSTEALLFSTPIGRRKINLPEIRRGRVEFDRYVVTVRHFFRRTHPLAGA